MVRSCRNSQQTHSLLMKLDFSKGKKLQMLNLQSESETDETVSAFWQALIVFTHEGEPAGMKTFSHIMSNF